MTPSSPDNANQWYTDQMPRYEELVHAVRFTLETLLKSSKIDYLNVSGRPKSRKSFLEKIERKNYSNYAKEMTDLAGLRVITFIEKDVQKVCDLIRSTFKVYEKDSLNKADELADDKMGYRSYHFICDLGNTRSTIAEYKPYEGMVFEIQVRTVLQHAWAEIEHDRNYKLAGVLPSMLKRRLNLIAGMLEIADREFNAIVQELDAHGTDVVRAANEGQGGRDIELTTAGVIEMVKARLAKYGLHPMYRIRNLDQAIEDLEKFGVKNLDDLSALLNDETMSACIDIMGQDFALSALGMLRRAMMYKDVDKYFNIRKEGIRVINEVTHAMLKARYGDKKIESMVGKKFVVR